MRVQKLEPYVIVKEPDLHFSMASYVINITWLPMTQKNTTQLTIEYDNQSYQNMIARTQKQCIQMRN